MKKFMKVCGITGAILIALGAVMSILAVGIRGSNRINQVVERVTGGTFHVSLNPFNGGFGIFGDNWTFGIFGEQPINIRIFDWGIFEDYDGSHEVYKGDVENGLSLGSDVSSLELDLGGCQFETKPSDDGEFHLETSGISSVQSYVDKGTLYVRSVRNHIFWGSSSGKITLYVPEEHYYDYVEIELGAGEIIFDGMNAGDVTLDVGAGHALVRGLQAQTLEASVGMGQIELRDMNVDRLEAEVGMGELVGNGSINRSASLECGMGNLQLKLTGSQQDFNYQLEAAVGNLSLGRDSFSGLAQERRIDNGASKNMEVECAVGNVSIQFEQ